MDIAVTGRHMDITPAIRQYAVDKAGKLPRYFDRIQFIEVVLWKADNHNYEAEMIIQADRTDQFVSKVKGTDLYACIDATVDKLERQLTDHKEIVRNRKGKTSMSG